MRRDRFPLDDLLDAVRPPPRDEAHFAVMLGAAPRSIFRLRADGLSEWQADRYACRLGFPAESIWADFLDESRAEREERIFQGLATARPDMAKEAT